MKQKRSHPGPLLAASLLGAAAIAAAFYFRPFPALEDSGLLASDPGIRVERGGAGLAFVPLSAPKSSGLVFYGAAQVPPEAYAYLARACASRGYTAILVSMPLNFAPFAPSRAEDAARSHPEVARWVIAGHSLGGRAAAGFVAHSSGRVGGAAVSALLLLAAYPGLHADLSTKSLPVVTVGASRDALTSPATIKAAGRRLPAAGRYVEISGGNHSQFGEYGPQPGDGLAEIPGPAQRRSVVDEALGLLDLVDAGTGK
jgi:pimeloyl-ACP methyl ester carboxylesterase